MRIPAAIERVEVPAALHAHGALFGDGFAKTAPRVTVVVVAGFGHRGFRLIIVGPVAPAP